MPLGVLGIAHATLGKAQTEPKHPRFLRIGASQNLFGGWAPPLWKYKFVSWDYDIPNWMEIHKSHVPNHQPEMS